MSEVYPFAGQDVASLVFHDGHFGRRGVAPGLFLFQAAFLRLGEVFSCRLVYSGHGANVVRRSGKKSNTEDASSPAGVMRRVMPQPQWSVETADELGCLQV